MPRKARGDPRKFMDGVRKEMNAVGSQFPEIGEKVFIPRGTVHRLSSSAEKEVRILEISFGEFDEEDIVRLDDVYGRVVQ